MRRKASEEENARYLRRIRSLEKYAVLPPRIALIVSCLAFLWPVILVNVGGKELSSILIIKRAILAYALLTLLSSVYIFAVAGRLQGLLLTKCVVFASVMADNVFLGVLVYGVMMEPLGGPWLSSPAEASLFWVYCALVVRNTFLFTAPPLQTLVNFLYILGHVSAILFNVWALHDFQLTHTAQRELFFRVIILALVSLCSSAIYALRERRLRAMDEARERTIRSLRLDIAGMLATQVAHELKNPLSIMTNAAFLLRTSNVHLDPTAAQQVQIIEEEIKRADRIISDLLDYAKLAEGRIESVLVNDSIDESLAALKNELDSGGVEVQRNYALDMPFLFIDAGQLRQVFTNILINAADAIENRGAITITTSYSTDAFIEVSIADTGNGMPPDVLAKIFTPFFTTKEKGTGMGLAIVENVVRVYRGEISAESEPGKGTTFHVRFPTRLALRTQEQRLNPRQPHRVRSRSPVRSAET